MRSFLLAFYRSLTDPMWLRAQSIFLGLAFRFFFGLSFIIVLLFVIPTLVRLPGEWQKFQNTTLAQVPDFKAEQKNGVLTVSGLTQPYQRQANGFGIMVNTVTTTSIASADIIKQTGWSAGLLVTRQQLQVFNEQTGQDEVRLWKEIGDFSWSKQDGLQLVNRFNNSTGWKVGLAAGLVVLAYIAFVVAKLLGLFAVASIALVIVRIARKDYSFKQLYTLGLLTLAVPVGVSALSGLLPITIPYLFSLTWLAWILAVVFSDKEGGIVVTDPIS